MSERFQDSQEEKRRDIRESLVRETLEKAGIPHADEYFVCGVPRRLDTLTTPEVRREMDEVLEKGQRRIAFDLRDTEYICSKGLYLLKELKVTTRRHNKGDIRLIDPSEKIIEFIKDAGMEGYFKILSTKEE